MSLNNTLKGFVLTDTADILLEVQTAFTNAFPALNLDPASPQGQLITFITERLTAAQSQIAYMTNIFTSGGMGVYLDNWAETFYGITRISPSPAMVDLIITGVAGTNIPKGFKVSNGGSVTFTTSLDALIGENGAVTVGATAENINQPQVLKDTLTTILTKIEGVERVNNPSNSTLPIAEETDAEFYRRAINLSPQFLTTSVFGSGLSQIANLEGVSKVGGYENVADTPLNIKGEILPAHSVNYIVAGGDPQIIAKTLLASKNPGAAMGGNTVIQVEEPISGQIYNVSFFRPADAPLKAEVKVKVDLANNYNYAETVINALQEYIAPLAFGSIVYPINAATALKGIGVQVLDLKMAKADGALGYEPIPFNFTQNIVLPIENIKVNGVS